MFRYQYEEYQSVKYQKLTLNLMSGYILSLVPSLNLNLTSCRLYLIWAMSLRQTKFNFLFLIKKMFCRKPCLYSSKEGIKKKYHDGTRPETPVSMASIHQLQFVDQTCQSMCVISQTRHNASPTRTVALGYTVGHNLFVKDSQNVHIVCISGFSLL